MKIGLLLGSFDPIHMGHLYMAVSVLNESLVDEVILVPSIQNPWKTESSDFRHRCFMAQLAIDEIENLVRIITGMSGVQIYITSDHGFLYTAKRLEDMDKMDRFSDSVIEQERRYVLTDKELDDTALMPVKGFYNKDGVYGYAPRENIRVKGWGSQNFVHGGISLQELVVPVIDYKFLRKGYKSYQVNKDKIGRASCRERV